MKKRVMIEIVIAIVLFIFAVCFYLGFFDKLTGQAVSNQGIDFEEHAIGPSASEQSCMMQCMGCSSPGVGCTGDSAQCQAQCNVAKPEETEETSCMEDCVAKGCGEFDFACQQKNQEICDKECGMIKEPEAKSEEEQCIRDCVNAESPGLICRAGEGGEKGDEICQRCAESCEHLYAGPCLTEIKLEEAKSACNTCEHCYGKPVMGDSGEGYECIVSVECADASAEFGDEPGTGEGIAAAIGNVFEGVGDFFRGIFGGESSEQ
ncbi:hypothetical protein J4402_03790 [Candidatus Pacearchaeota archaeon]|nr:hypothetical protein [Candidatus Pacearchaeota archaeon]